MNLAGVSQALASLALLAGLLGAVLLVVQAVPAGRRRLATHAAGGQAWLLAAAWLVAAVATAGSLYYSEVAGLRPCVLCWYQRIAMYPLVLVLGAALVTADEEGWRYVLPLSLAGLLISAYHVAIELRPSLSVVTCSADIPCTIRYFAVFGFVSIPVMAACGFLLISALALAIRLGGRAEPQVGQRL